MKLRRFDHLVLTVKDLSRTLDFYGRVLGVPVEENRGRWVIRIGEAKFNVHRRPGEFQPAAERPVSGALDLCLELEPGESLEAAFEEVKAAGAEPVLGIVNRTGARGPMRSFYLRDPDGTLVEICSYNR